MAPALGVEGTLRHCFGVGGSERGGDGVVPAEGAGAVEVGACGWVFEEGGGAADGVVGAGVVVGGGGAVPFYVEGEAEGKFVGGEAEGLVGREGGEGGGDAGVVGCGVVAPVHEVVGHDVEEVEGGGDEGGGGGGEGEHVAREAGDGGREEFVGEGGAEGGEEEGLGFDFPGFCPVGDLLVVFAVPTVVNVSGAVRRRSVEKSLGGLSLLTLGIPSQCRRLWGIRYLDIENRNSQVGRTVCSSSVYHCFHILRK